MRCMLIVDHTRNRDHLITSKRMRNIAVKLFSKSYRHVGHATKHEEVAKKCEGRGQSSYGN